MKMKRFLVVILLMIALVPASTAQIPEAEPPGWEIGWEGEDDIVIFELDPDTYAFDLILEFISSAPKLLNPNLLISA